MQPGSGITAKGATAISNGLNAFPGVLAYMAAFPQHTRNAAPHGEAWLVARQQGADERMGSGPMTAAAISDDGRVGRVRYPLPTGLAVFLWLGGLVATPAMSQTPDATQLMQPVNRLANAINTAAEACPEGVFTADSAVFDDFAPFRWTGRQTGCAWYGALVGTDAPTRAAFLALHARLTLGAPMFTRGPADEVYFVVPSTFLFDSDAGKRISQTASWIMIERRTPAGWLITGHAWAIGSETPAAR
jgi:hypothetical protein